VLFRSDALRADGRAVSFLPINPRFPRPLGGVRQLPVIRTLLNQALYLPGLARLAAVDVVHVFSASYASFLLAPLPAMAVARSLGKRVVLHYHSGEADDHLARWGVLVHPWLRLADHIVVPSEYLRAVFATYGYEAQVIPNVVDLARFAYRERRPLSPHLLSARNLEPIYRVDVIIEAYARLKQTMPRATLTIAGYGSEEARLRRLAANLSDVTFVGRVEPAAMPRLYADAGIFINASVVDNQPVSILEAFASGLPVVSTPTGDIAAMVRDHVTGLLVPQEDPGAIAGAVSWLIANPDDATDMAQRAHDAATGFTWPVVREAWASIYRTPGGHAHTSEPCIAPRHTN
jgi:glycosyltransferase involved in cell wall biosynthesis